MRTGSELEKHLGERIGTHRPWIDVRLSRLFGWFRGPVVVNRAELIKLQERVAALEEKKG